MNKLLIFLFTFGLLLIFIIRSFPFALRLQPLFRISCLSHRLVLIFNCKASIVKSLLRPQPFDDLKLFYTLLQKI
ncbi:hypothetical protein BY996DRAFT_7605670 [Phakopsora pachyrhizi]|nr:hypothetical protein BY996DRAFT_7605670 [Phakopsora pachyrhizi]